MGTRRSTRGEEAKREEAEWNLAQYGAEFRTLAESCPAAILIAAGEKLVFVNPAFESITNFSREEALSLRFYEVVHPDMRELAKKRGLARQKGEEVPSRYELKCITRDGQVKWMDIAATLIDYEGKTATLATAYDITECRQARDEIIERERQLETKTRDLEEANAALKALLKHRERDRIEFEENLLMNIKELVLPYIEKLKKIHLDRTQVMYLEIVENNLMEVVSPFMKNLSSKHQGLTPTEIQVAALVREGKTTKDIAALLNRWPRAIEFHRNNLRRKIGLTREKANLRSYLLSLQ